MNLEILFLASGIMYFITNLAYSIFAWWRDIKQREYNERMYDLHLTNRDKYMKKAISERIDKAVSGILIRNSDIIELCLIRQKKKIQKEIEDMET